MTTTVRTKPHALAWIAGIAVTTFSLVGIAAIMGWIPTSLGQRESVVVAKIEPPRVTTTPRTRVDQPAAAKLKAAPAAAALQVARAPAAKAICAECGVIESVRTVDAAGAGSGLGAIGGAVVGGVAGNQIGRGTGRTVATVAGAVGGAVAGHHVEKYVTSGKSHEIVVRFENGSIQTFHQAAAPTWHTGDRVKVVNGVLQLNS